MDTASILLVTASFLLVAATAGLLIASVVYAKATRQMNRIVSRQSEMAKLQAYLNAHYAMIISPHDSMRKLIHKVSKPFLDKFDENYEKVLNNIFQKCNR